MRASTSRKRVRVGFSPTPSIARAAPVRTAAPTRNAADETSPGTAAANPSCSNARTDASPGANADRGAERRQRSFGVVAGRGGLADRGRTLRGETGEQDGALHLGARDLRPMLDPAERAAADHERRVPVRRSNVGAHRPQRSATRSIGRAVQARVAVQLGLEGRRRARRPAGASSCPSSSSPAWRRPGEAKLDRAPRARGPALEVEGRSSWNGHRLPGAGIRSPTLECISSILAHDRGQTARRRLHVEGTRGALGARSGRARWRRGSNHRWAIDLSPGTEVSPPSNAPGWTVARTGLTPVAGARTSARAGRARRPRPRRRPP